MKNCILIFSLVVTTVNLFAQVKTVHLKQQCDNKRIDQKLLNKLLTNKRTATRQSSKTTTPVAERLIAESGYAHAIFPLDSIIVDTAIITDSAKYGYSSSRSSYFNYNFMTYYNNYSIDGAAIFGLAHCFGEGRNNEPSMLSDTTQIFNLSPFTTSIALFDTRYAIYDSYDNIIDYADIYSDSGFYTNNKYANTFDGSQNISTSLVFSQTSSFSYDTSEYRLFIYDSLNNLIEDSTNEYIGGSVFSPLEKWMYSYDDSGNLAQASYYIFDSASTPPWNEEIRYLMTYTSDNRIRTIGIYADSSYGWIPMNVDSFGYNTSGVDYADYIQERFYADSGILTDYVIMTKHIASGGFPDTVFTSRYLYDGTYTSKDFKTFSYDSYDEPTIALQYDFLFDSTMVTGAYDSTYSFVNYYYYGTYSKNYNNVVSITSAPETINLYPNPANNIVHIWRPTVAKGTQTSIKFINATGQIVKSENLSWLHETEAIATSGLIPGIYLFTLQDKGSKNVYAKTIIKQ